MKKNYVSPCANLVNIEVAQMLAASAPQYRPFLDNTSNSEQGSVWGNLWKK